MFFKEYVGLIFECFVCVVGDCFELFVSRDVLNVKVFVELIFFCMFFFDVVN